MTPFQSFIDQCSDDELSSLLAGQRSISCNDKHYRLDNQGVNLAGFELDQQNLRAAVSHHEPAILAQLFRQHPLCEIEFNFQARRLFEQIGISRFCRHAGHRQNHALMIDGSQLVAVAADDARSQYGYYCERPGLLTETEAQQATLNWLASGEAYEDYRVKTHCRYVCNPAAE